jgi:DNA-binding NarL/FixJ family response regulator
VAAVAPEMNTRWGYQLSRQKLPRATSETPTAPVSLNAREWQIILLVVNGKFNKEIAGELQLSEATVKEYLNRIFKKLKIYSRTELAVWAVRREYESRGLQSDRPV